MKDGFIRVAAATPEIRVADCEYNRKQVERMLKEAWEQKARIVVFPELCMTGYSCGDLFLQELLLSGCVSELEKLLEASGNLDILGVVGMPLAVNGGFTMKKFNDIWVFIEMSNNRPKRVSLELLAKAAELAAEAGSKAVPVICPKTSDYSPAAIIRALKSAIEEAAPSALLFGSTPLG